MKHWNLFFNHIITCILFLAFGILFAVLVIFPESEIHNNVDSFKANVMAELSK